MTDNTDNLVISQKKLNLLLGGLAIAIPTLLYLGNLYIFNVSEIMGSISSYYHSDMRDVFVGVLFSMGVFMISYEGYDLGDRILSTLGGALIIIVALAPTSPSGTERDIIGTVHLLAAVGFYLILTIFCLFRFTKSNESQSKTRLKRLRNLIYYISGLLILTSIILIILTESSILSLPIENSTFWFEFTANSAFGTAWLIKGEGIFFLNDDPIFEMKPWEIFGFLMLIVLLVGSGLMIFNIFIA